MAKKLRDEDLVLNIIVNGDKGKKEMGELERAIKDTNLEIKQLQAEQRRLALQGKTETEAYNALTAAIKEKNNAITIAESRLIELRKGMKLTEMTMSDLRREQKRLSTLLNTAIPGTDNYKAYDAQLKVVQGRIDELTGKAKESSLNIGAMANKFNQYIGVISAGILTVTGIVAAIRKVTDTFAEFDDKLADVQKTTGLTKFAVVEINEELKKIDTRTQQQDLLGLAQVAGKLGYSSKEDILGFVKAADQIGVALSQDLGGNVEEAINQIGKMVAVFKVNENYSIEQSLLKVGSAINYLGASSTASEEYIVDLTKRVGGIAPSANISIQNIMGLAATLDQLGQSGEVAGTMFNTIIPDMFKNTGEYANTAGMKLKDFTELLNNDANAAFIKVLSGLKGNNKGLGEMTAKLDALGIDGSRSTGVLTALANNIGVLQQQQAMSNKAFAQGSSLSQEFAIKNETAAAKIDKAKKALYNLTVELGEKLQPVVSATISSFSLFVRVLSAIIGFTIDHAKAIAFANTAFVAYHVYLKIAGVLISWENIEKKASIALTKLKVFWDNVQIASLRLLSAGYALVTGNMAAAKVEMAAFNAITKANPIAILIAVLAAGVIAISLYTKKLTDAEKAQKMLNDISTQASKSISEEKINISNLLNIIKSEVATRVEKNAAIAKLREMMPEHLKAYSTEDILAGNATEAIKKYVAALETKARVEATSKKQADLQNEISDLQLKKKDGFKNASFLEKVKAGLAPGRKEKSAEEVYLDDLDKQIKDKKRLSEILTTKSQKDLTEMLVNEEKVTKTTKKITDMTLGELKSKQEALNKELDGTVKNSKKYFEILSQIHQIEKILNSDKSSQKEENSAQKNANQARESLKQLNKDIEDLSFDRLKNQATANEKEILEDAKKYDALIHKLQDFKKQKGVTNAQIVEADNKIKNLEKDKQESANAIRLRQEQALQEKILKLRESLTTFQKTEYDKQIDIINKFYDELNAEYKNNPEQVKLNEINRAKDLTNAKLSEEERFHEEKKRIKYEYDNLTNNPDNELDKINQKYDAEIEALKAKFSQELQLTQEFTDQVAAIEVNREIEKADLVKNTVSKEKREKITMYQNIADGAFSIFAANTQRQTDIELNRLNQSKEKELANKNLSEEQKNAIIAKYAKKEAEIKRKAFMQNQVASVAQAIVNTALAVTMAMAQTGVLSPFVIPGILAAGAAQVAVILAQKGPSVDGFEQGGFVNVTRQQDGKQFNAKNTPNNRGYIAKPSLLVSENGTEFVANAQAVKNPTIKPFLDVIDIAQRNGNISAINLNKYIQRPSLPAMGKESGGFINTNSPFVNNIINNNQELVSFINAQKQILIKLSKQLDAPIQANVSLLGKNGLNAKQQELQDLQNLNNL